MGDRMRTIQYDRMRTIQDDRMSAIGDDGIRAIMRMVELWQWEIE